MCTSNGNFSEFTSACIEIISRVSDDESSIQVISNLKFIHLFLGCGDGRNGLLYLMTIYKLKAFHTAIMLLCIHSTDTQLTENIARQAQTAAQISILNAT
jgi:hypothetical protein